MKASNPPIVLEYKLNSSISDTWRAITQHDQMILWFFENIPSFEAKASFETHFVVHSGERKFTHLWKIKEVEPFKRLVYSWKYKEYPGNSLLTFSLDQIKDHTVLKLEMAILEDFPSDIPEFNRNSCIGGWDYFIGDNLRKYLDK